MPSASESAVSSGIAALRRRWPSVVAGEPIELSGSGRSAVYRVPLEQAPVASAIVKSHPPAGRPGALENESVAAAVFTALPGPAVGPQLLAHDLYERVIVLSDLGEHPALSEVLLGTDALAAADGLRAWAAALGRIAARTRNPRPLVEDARRRLGVARLTLPLDGYFRRSVERFREHAERRFGVPAPAGLDTDLESVLLLLEPSSYDILSPADACPDNNQLTPAGVRFFDFEFAGVCSLFLDAAYTVLPFPTCWCSLEMPPELISEIGEIYRQQVVPAFPGLGDDEAWYGNLVRAGVLCLMPLLNPMWDSAPGTAAGGEFEVQGVGFPGLAARIHFRLNRLLSLPETGIPALTSMLRQIEQALVAECGADALAVPLYPAFRPRAG